MAGVAEQLKSAREAAQLTIPQVVASTNLKTDQVDAMERGNWELFPASIYARGFARTYARLLKLPEDQLLAELDAELGLTGKFREGADEVWRKLTILDRFTLLLSRVNWRIFGPFLAVVLVIVLAAILIQKFRPTISDDPLKGVGDGQISAPIGPGGMVLPLPTNSIPPPR